MVVFDESKERNLWASVLEKAIEDLNVTETKHEMNNNYEQFWQRKAAAWFRSSVKDIGSFLWICMILDLDSDVVRSLVLGCRKGGKFEI